MCVSVCQRRSSHTEWADKLDTRGLREERVVATTSDAIMSTWMANLWTTSPGEGDAYKHTDVARTPKNYALYFGHSSHAAKRVARKRECKCNCALFANFF